MFTHDVYRNVRVRVVILRDGRMLLFPPASDGTGRDPYRSLPGGGLQPNESLYEAGEREVLEETGVRVKVTSVAFVRECVVPKCVSVEEMKRVLRVWDAVGQMLEAGPEYERGQARVTRRWTSMARGVGELSNHAFALEVYLWAELCEGESGQRRPDDVFGAVAEWVPLEQVEHEPLFPTELKALARNLAEGRPAVGVPSFVTEPGTPSDEPDCSAFRVVRPEPTEG